MNIKGLSLPKTTRDIVAARAYIGLSQEDFGDICGRSKNAQIAIEKGKTTPKTDYWDVMLPFCAGHGIKFLPQGGFMIDENIVQVFEGEDCFVKLVDNILATCEAGDEVLFLGNDDRKSTKKVIAKDSELYKAGIYPKYLVEDENDYLLGPIEDYKATNSKFFVPTDLTVIYKGKVAFDLWEFNKKKKIQKIIVLNEPIIFNRMSDYFNKLWKNGKKIKKSATKQIFFKKKK
jgi:hypothetical protein